MKHVDLKAIRAKVLKTLVAELDATLQPLGYDGTETEWPKASKFGKSILQLLKSSRYINVERLPCFVLIPRFSRSGTRDGFVLTQFQAFCP